jgi:uncharacterized membrane protein
MKTIVWTLFVLLVSALYAVVAVAAEYSFQAIKVPNASDTFALGINDHGDVVGYYRHIGDLSLNLYGFFYSDGEFFDIGAPWEFPVDINQSGEIVTYVGDVIKKHETISLNVYANGLNNRGTVVGWRSVPGTNGLAFVWQKGIFTSIVTPADIPGILGSSATGINEKNQIVGYYFFDAPCPLCLFEFHGFIKDGEQIITFDHPNGAAFPAGINNKGEIVGFFHDTYFGGSFHFSDGVFTDLTEANPDACCGINLTGINNRGQIVGHYSQFGENIGFIGTPKK